QGRRFRGMQALSPSWQSPDASAYWSSTSGPGHTAGMPMPPAPELLEAAPAHWIDKAAISMEVDLSTETNSVRASQGGIILRSPAMPGQRYRVSAPVTASL